MGLSQRICRRPSGRAGTWIDREALPQYAHGGGSPRFSLLRIFNGFGLCFDYRAAGGDGTVLHVTGAERPKFMNDLIFVAVIAGFFIAAALYVRFCEKL